MTHKTNQQLASLHCAHHQALIEAIQAVVGLLDDLDLHGFYFGEPHEVLDIQVPVDLGDEALRAEICAKLATALNTQVRRETRFCRTRGWLFVEGSISGHRVRFYAPMLRLRLRRKPTA